MGKTGDTKRQILEILHAKNGTLTDISDKLELAPSTVSQHLKELVDSGQIRLADDRPRKWKYYEINRGQPASPYDRGFQMKQIFIPIAAIALIAILAAGLYISGGSGVAVAQQVYIAPGSAVPNGSTVFSVSDSPQFYNISALFITVTNASVRSTSGKWYRIPLQEHTFNLVGLRNISEILSGVNLSVGSYDAVSLSVSNVSAIVNGSSEGVFLPSSKLLVLGRFNISNNSTNWVNIDFDLESSLHITSNGSLIMLPVLRVDRDTGEGMSLNSSSIIVARGPLYSHEAFEFGMEANGIMAGNFTMPQNMSMGFSDGRIRGFGRGPAPFFVTTGRGFLMGSNAAWFLNGNFLNGTWNGLAAGWPGPMGANGTNVSWSSNGIAGCPYPGGGCGQHPTPGGPAWNGSSGAGQNLTVGWGPGGGAGPWRIGLPPQVIGGNSSRYVDCRPHDGGILCNENDSANVVITGGRAGIRGGVCIGVGPGGRC